MAQESHVLGKGMHHMLPEAPTSVLSKPFPVTVYTKGHTPTPLLTPQTQVSGDSNCMAGKVG